MKLFFQYLAVAAVAGVTVAAWGAFEPRTPSPSQETSPLLALVEASPPDQSLGAAPDEAIRMAFARPVDPASANEQAIRVFGRWSGPHSGTIAVEAQGTELVFTPAVPFHPGEWVTVTLASSLRDAGGQPLTGGAQWGFWIQAGAGAWDFAELGRIPVRRPGEDQVRSYGAYAADFDGDGFGDLMIPNENSNDVRVFLNDGTGRYDGFDLYPIPGGNTPSTNEGGDFDGDGITDFAVGNAAGNLVSVFRGLGDGTFEHHAGYPVGRGIRGLCVLDLNSDGAADLVAASDQAHTVSTLINDGQGTFEVTQALRPMDRGVRSCATGDANGDGITDVFVGSNATSEVAVLLSDGSGTLTPQAPVNAGGGPWMLVSGDMNGDGFVDLVSAATPGGAVMVMLGDGQGGFGTPMRYSTGRMTLAVDLGDLDGDGDLDVVASVFTSADWVVFENDGSGNLTERMRLKSTEAGSCAILHDRDNDGDLDITGIDEMDDWVVLFENR
jgi:hypothetical protein